MEINPVTSIVVYNPATASIAAISSLPAIITNTVAYTVTYALQSSICRKLLFTGAMYTAGATIIASVGAIPVATAAAIVWLL